MSVDLRDRFFVLSSGDGSPAEAERYRAEVDATHAEPVASVDGLDVSWHPTARYKAVRLVDADRIDEPVRHLFARPAPDAPHLAAAFADPHELSFRTFENIVPLDRLFEDVALDVELAGHTARAEGVHTFEVRLPAEARDRLERLDELNLYVTPLNAASRGGVRFIFHSALLAEALTAAVAEALPPAAGEGFSHVNPVFRCNRFEPGDANFTGTATRRTSTRPGGTSRGTRCCCTSPAAPVHRHWTSATAPRSTASTRSRVSSSISGASMKVPRSTTAARCSCAPSWSSPPTGSSSRRRSGRCSARRAT
ncbi:hypothetical protein GCM10027610_034900 [Dactylosporangium cerinum]